jgi:acid phosphatase family membrane protein YuiD
MKTIIAEVANNKIFLFTLLSWFIAQALKVATGYLRYKKFDFRWFVGTGGMPSSHAAAASCLAISVGLHYGFDGVCFALAASFAIVVMFDAQGVRRATGKQARILNKIMDDIYWQKRIEERRLRELVGHTPVEVIAGFFLGLAVAFLSQ